MVRSLSVFHLKGAGDKRRRICGPCRDAARIPRTAEARFREKTKQYGITPEQYRALLAAQAGVCAICGTAPTPKRRLHVDHCHTSGRVRALLCQPCNTQLGSYEKMRDLAAAYLAKYGAGNPLLAYDAAPVSSDAAA
ncbi:MAG: vBYenPAB5 [Nonomuraea muscovyensis]|nr:vBYenPAB5 [Nonomuraea muscovyensis]